MLQLTPHMRLLACVDPIDFRQGGDGLVRICRDKLARGRSVPRNRIRVPQSVSDGSQGSRLRGARFLALPKTAVDWSVWLVAGR
jgi:hypothetical protein